MWEKYLMFSSMLKQRSRYLDMSYSFGKQFALFWLLTPSPAQKKNKKHTHQKLPSLHKIYELITEPFSIVLQCIVHVLPIEILHAEY